jgi:hypothetical protein
VTYLVALPREIRYTADEHDLHYYERREPKAQASSWVVLRAAFARSRRSPGSSAMFDRIQTWWRRRSAPEADGKDTFNSRVDTMTASRGDDAVSEGGSIPPNYLPTGVDEGRPKK